MGRAHYKHGMPRCRQEYDESGMNVIIYHDESHKESWQVLFMDLTLVALLINLSFFLYNCGNTAEAVFITGSYLSLCLSIPLLWTLCFHSSPCLCTQGDCSSFSITPEYTSKTSHQDSNVHTMQQRSLILEHYSGCS